MTIDETSLRPYVDGELPRDQADALEQALDESPELREQLQAMRASCLPYAAAFEAQRLPPVPESLRQSVAAMTAPPTAAAANGIGRSRRRWAVAGAALAASFAAGVVLPRLWRDANTPSTGNAPWIDAIADYQSLYVRATVDQTHEDLAHSRTVLTEFAARTQHAVAVPDLRAAGFSFVRLQRLAFGGAPMLQMVYLPERGDPAALCVLPTTRGDAAIGMQRRGALSVAAWQLGGLAYVFAANMALAQTRTVAEQLAARRFGALVSVV